MTCQLTPPNDEFQGTSSDQVQRNRTVRLQTVLTLDQTLVSNVLNHLLALCSLSTRLREQSTTTGGLKFLRKIVSLANLRPS